MSTAKTPLWARPVVHKLVTITPAMMPLDVRVMAQRERLDRVSPATWGMWFDTARRYGASSGPWRGALDALVREAWGDGARVVIQLVASGGWRPCVYRRQAGAWTRVEAATFFLANYNTKAEALVAALEAAP